MTPSPKTSAKKRASHLVEEEGRERIKGGKEEGKRPPEVLRR